MLDINELIEITLKKSDDFLVIKETLTRMGVSSKKDKSLYQSCHILHKKGKFYIVHFKEMFKLDGKTSDFSSEDIGRRNTIANLLADWGLLTLVNPEKSKEPVVPMSALKIIHHDDKNEWKLIPKYTIGNKKKF